MYVYMANPNALTETLLHTELNKQIISIVFKFMGHAVAQLVEALCYKPEGRGFESR
jgi:hypothetical protein